MKFSVFVYLSQGRRRPKRAQLLTACETAELATLLAKCIRWTFGCPAWVADYFQPADVQSITQRAAFEIERQELRKGAA